jgi:hypothetical protein
MCQHKKIIKLAAILMSDLRYHTNTYKYVHTHLCVFWQAPVIFNFGRICRINVYIVIEASEHKFGPGRYIFMST